jgi:hypothetical protein
MGGFGVYIYIYIRFALACVLSLRCGGVPVGVVYIYIIYIQDFNGSLRFAVLILILVRMGLCAVLACVGLHAQR